MIARVVGLVLLACVIIGFGLALQMFQKRGGPPGDFLRWWAVLTGSVFLIAVIVTVALAVAMSTPGV